MNQALISKIKDKSTISASSRNLVQGMETMKEKFVQFVRCKQILTHGSNQIACSEMPEISIHHKSSKKSSPRLRKFKFKIIGLFPRSRTTKIMICSLIITSTMTLSKRTFVISKDWYMSKIQNFAMHFIRDKKNSLIEFKMKLMPFQQKNEADSVVTPVHPRNLQ